MNEQLPPPLDQHADGEINDDLLEEGIESRSRAHSMAASWGAFIPILGMAVSAYFLAQSKDDLLYLFSSSTPIDLGQPSDYHLERARPGAYARIAGEVHSQGKHFQEGKSAGIIWPITGAPLLIERRDLESLWGRVEAEGRLQSDDQLVPAFHKVIALLLGTEELGSPGPHGHVWLLTQGRAPRGLDRTNLWILALVAIFGVNAWLVVRPILRR